MNPSTRLHSLLLATSCLVASNLCASAALAGGPTGGTVVVGSATITNPNGSRTVVTQSSNRALIDWTSFSVPSGSTVKFRQPGSNSITVNRVTGPDASAIFGNLLANGNIWLLNGNGILFGKGSQINVGSLIATTSDLSDEDFRNGRYRFNQASANRNAAVVNAGTIKADAKGSVVLSAARVANEGVIQANLGTVVLGGASEFAVDIDGDNLLRYQVTAPVRHAPKNEDGSVAGALVSNSGTIRANGGSVLMTARAARNVQDNVINNSGMVEATSVHAHDGEIDLDAGANGTVDDSGTLDASGRDAGETGGTVQVSGNAVNIADGARVDASGYAGGGRVHIGGNFHGEGGVRQADTTTIGRAVITADAIVRGNGGRVSVWSKDKTQFSGRISARGGLHGGNGGFIETSGVGNLQIGLKAHVRTTARKGATGTWLLDPFSVYIEDCSDDCGFDTGQETIDPSTVVANLGSSNMTISADFIGVYNDIEYSSAHTLSLLSTGEIDVDGNILNSKASGGGDINLIGGWDNTTTSLSHLTDPGVFGNNEGSVEIGGQHIGSDGQNQNSNIAVGSRSGTTTVAAAAIDVSSGGFNNTNTQIGYEGNGGGDIIVDATGNLTVSVGSSASGYAQIGNGDAQGDDDSITGVTGNITLNIDGTTTLSDINTSGEAWIGNGYDGGSTATGNLTIVTGDLDIESFDGNRLGEIIQDSLQGSGTPTASTGGDFTLALDSEVGTSKLGDLLGDDLSYKSSHTLSLVSDTNLSLRWSIQNSGTGDLNIISGWNTGAVSAADLIADGAASIVSNNAYGVANGDSGGDMTLGGIEHDVAFGSKGGVTTLAGGDVTLNAASGSVLVGFNGRGATGDITVDAKGNVKLSSGGDGQYTQIGHGGADSTGSESGDITVNATGAVRLLGGDGFNAYAQIGHGGTNANNDPSASFSYSGDIAVSGASVVMQGGDGGASYVQIGHGGQNVGNDPTVAITEKNIGDISVTARTGSVSLMAGSGNAYAQIGHGGAYNGIVFSDDDGVFPTATNTGDITVKARQGSVTLTATGDSNADDQSTYAEIGHGGVSSSGSSSGDILITAGGDLTLTGGTAQPDGYGLAYSQIGNGAGSNDPQTDSGDITLNIGGNLTLQGSPGLSAYSDYVQIGNGSVLNLGSGNSAVSGDIDITVGGTTAVQSNAGASDVWIGNIAGSGTETGDVTLVTKDFDASDDRNGDLAQFITSDLSGGDFTLGTTDANQFGEIGGLNYSSTHDLTLLAAGEFLLTNSIQNAGSGAITVVGGWDGHTLGTGAQIVAAGAYGKHNNDVSIGGEGEGGAEGDVSLGSKNGTTTVAGNNVRLEADNGVAQIGFAGKGDGDIDVAARHDIDLTAFDNEAALIGNGTNTVSGKVGGDITLTTLTGGVFLEAFNGGIAQVGNIGGANSILGGNISIDTNGGALSVIAEEETADRHPIRRASSSFIGGGTTTAHIGNGGLNATGKISGNISISTDGGTVSVKAETDDTIATIGDLAFGDASEKGSITLDAGDGVLQLASDGSSSYAQIGNWERNDSTKTIGGDITIDAGDISMLSDGSAASSQIGNGNYLGPQLTGAMSGDITINAASLAMTGAAPTTSSFEEVRIGNLGSGPVSGTLTVNTTGDIALQQTGNGATSIGNFSNPHSFDGTTFTNLQGEASGNLDVTAGGDISMTATGAGSFVSMEIGGVTTGNVDITAHGNVSLASNNGGQVFVGGYEYDDGGANVSVTSQTGSVSAQATGDASNVQIGNAENATNTGAITGNVSVTAAKNIVVATNSGTGSYARVGNLGDAEGSATGNTTLSAGNNLKIVDAEASLIGNTAGSYSGDVTVGGKSLNGDILPSLNNDLPFGNFTLNLTGKTLFTLASDLDYTSTHTLTLNNGGDIKINGAIANSGNGSIAINAGGTLTDAKAVTTAGGNIALTSGTGMALNGAIATSGAGNIALNSGGAMGVNGNVTTGSGTVAMTSGGALTTDGAVKTSGSVTLASNGDATIGGPVQAGLLSVNAGGDVAFNAAAQTSGNGDITIKSGGDIVFAATVQNGGNGDINVAAKGNVTAGGNSANGGVFVGSKHGNLTLAADNVTLNASKGYAQLGYHGAGSGGVSVTASGDVALNGGSHNAYYAQIGNGGYQTSGNQSGDITVAALGDVSLNGGSGQEAYAQIGHGGAEADKNATSYTNAGLITVSGQNVELAAGGGNASYAQIGNGGYLLGQGLKGNGVNSGDIDVTAVDDVTITGGGTNAYAQIGNGGSKTNDAPGANATGSNEGDINVAVSSATGAVTMAAGAGDASYAQIGNGGFASDAPTDADSAHFTDSGNITVSDLSISGSDTGTDGYAQIGNGDSSLNNVGNVSGDITIAAGNITVHDGAADGASAQIGGATGRGTVTGNIFGYNPGGGDTGNPGIVAVLIQNNTTPDTVDLVDQTPPVYLGPNDLVDRLPGDVDSVNPLQQLANANGDDTYEGTQDSDKATDSLGRSLSGEHGHNKPATVVSRWVIPGMLTQVVSYNQSQARPIPSADQDYPSWGNEALWRW